MFDIGSTELLLIAVVAVIVIGPKDLPRALYKLGQVVGKARAMSRHFRSGIDAMIREAEMEELEKKWAAENRRIMDQHPAMEALPSPADNGAVEAAETGGVEEPTSGAAAPKPTMTEANSATDRSDA
ncbi:MAG: Sec-independent protein translocase protein TatB [Sphingobium sp.]